ncbi:hypothetical protein DENSPDRAFT_864419 [Dentipellis sp. KUC8613]|nr:hypothetical protein DENSPDRAFT_864419 [Dentipellis sp. KUC8613]
MDAIDQRARRDSDDRPDHPRPPAYSRPLPTAPRSDAQPTGYTLMVAGQRTGKTSFLRLLLDTSTVSPFASKDQLASVAKFVQGCAGHTAHIRTVSIDVQVDPFDSAPKQPVMLTLVDTPSLDFSDQASSERIMDDMLRHVDSKFLESVEDDYKAQTGDHHVHLCIYFLDPDYIVPPHVPTPPAPLLPRTRTNSVSIPDPEPVILEPPVTTNPLLCRPTLPPADVTAIRRLSARVNVLPVVARADTLTNDRLAAIKMAIRRDLAEAGIGFGIFDLDTPSQYQYDIASSNLNGDSKVYPGLTNGSSSSSSASSPTSPVTPFLRLPFALISPDIYSHSDGVTRATPSRHELVIQYTPNHSPISNYHIPSHKFVRGKFVRSYRWGVLDVLDHNHCDFLPLRHAIFHHMQTLQKYTREYLLDRYRVETLATRPPIEGHTQQSSAPSQLPPLSNTSRPIVTIETAPSHAPVPRHANIPPSRQAPAPTVQPLPPIPALSDSGPESNKPFASNPKSARQRTKKITVACNFCRSRKLKCDGGRPACHQCLKRSNACDYMAPQKRRGGVRQRRQFGSDSDAGSGDDPSVEMEASQSPEILTKPLARVLNPTPEKPSRDTTLSSFGGNAMERRDRDDFHVLPPLAQPPSAVEQLHSAGADRRAMHVDGLERPLPSLAFPPAPPLNASAPPMLPPIRPADEEPASAPGPVPASAPAASSATQPSTQRKRASTVSGKGNRSSSNYGPKVVACNFCRARKTKCDGAHPTCSSCTRRSLPCSYVNDAGAAGASRRKASAPAPSSDQGSGMSSSTAPSASQPPNQYHEPEGYNVYPEDRDIKRERGDEENHPSKRIRVEGTAASSSVAVFGIP